MHIRMTEGLAVASISMEGNDSSDDVTLGGVSV